MVAATRDSTQTHAPPTSVEEEALKRNTDCVYFLASPLTCKKGSDCEYRHSEYARVNPRDCWFWLNGNCLNPKCAFRHPPLDGLLGTQAAGPAGAPIPPQQSSLPPTPHASHDSGKQAVPCIFFQKGLCLKGDRCAFLHGINPTGTKPLQSQGAGPSTLNSFPKKASGGLQKCSQDPPKVTLNSTKLTSTSVAPKPAAKAEIPSVNVVNIGKNPPPARGVDDGFSSYRPSTSTLANGSSQGRISRVQQTNTGDDYSSYKEKEADEFLKESSPGFDVLVDDELEESDYYHNEDQFGRSVGHEEYDMDRPEEYGALSEIDHEMFQRSYDQKPGQYGWDQHREPTNHRDQRAYFKGESPDRMGESDLRYHLSKQRRVNGLRSVVSHDFVPDSHVEEHNNRASLHSREGSGGSRLKGRIKFPGRSGAANGVDVHQERELDSRGRNSARLYQGGRFKERLRGRVQDDYNGSGRNFSGSSRVRRETVDDKSIDFTGPKSLAELKATEAPKRGLQSSITIGGDASFEGPKPLSVLLKRKREGEDEDEDEDGDKPGDAFLAKTGEDGSAAVPQDNRRTSGPPLEQKKGVENKDGPVMEGGTEDVEIDVDDQRAGESDDEQGEEGDYNYDEGENVDVDAEGEEEYLDDDDGEDFAKKVGVMFS